MPLPFRHAALAALVTVAACLAAPVAAPLHAQLPALDSLRTRTIPGGIAVALPERWRPLPGAVQDAVMRVVGTAAATARDSVLRAAFAAGQPVMLLYEIEPGAPDYSVNLNVAPSPGLRPTSFAEATPEQRRAALAPLCDGVRALLARMGGTVAACDAPEFETVGARTVAVTRLVRSGGAGPVTAWIVQFPDADMIYTLTVTVLEAREAELGPLARRIWRSFVLDAR